MLRGIMVIALAAYWASAGMLCAQSQAEMNATAWAKLEKVDGELNVLYKKVLAEHAKEPEFSADLREAQRAWMKFVDYHLKSLFPVKPGQEPQEVYGSIYLLGYPSAKAAMTEQRIEQLKMLVTGEEAR